MRHSYPKGSTAGDGRKCNKCGHVDGPVPVSGSTTSSAVPGASSVLSSGEGAETFVANLPAHSPLGASSAHRWMNCTGSVALTELLQKSADFEDDDPDYRRDGVQAHALAAHCLQSDMDAWEAMGPDFPDLDDEMMSAVQVYLDHCRSLPSRIVHVEHRMHRPEFHRLAFGTGDFISVHCTEAVLDIVDYKHGAGVYVDVVDNDQLKYYAYLFIGEDHDEFPDETTVRLHIVQPRIEGAKPVRDWETRAGSIRRWARETLLPAMNKVATERYLSMGEWCRFCPAKVICPAMACLSDEMVHKIEKHKPEDRVKALDDGPLGDWYTKAQMLKMFIKTIEAEAERRVLNGAAVPGVKAVNKKAWRVFKDAAPIVDTFGADGVKPKSVAEIEKLSGGPEFVAEWAFNANSGQLAIAPESDARKAVEIKTGAQTFQIAEAAE